MSLALKRLFAYWIDFMIMVVCLIIPQWFISGLTQGYPFSKLTTGLEIELWVLLTISLPVWLYFIVSEFFKHQTIGKRLLKLVVTTNDGCNITLGQSIVRTALKLLPWELTHIIILIPEPWWSVTEPTNSSLIYIPNFMILLYIVILFMNKGVKGLHDYISSTKVCSHTENVNRDCQ